MNSNNNIINNIYPTFTKVTNVQILPDNDKINNEKKFINNKIKNNSNINDLENKKENINENNIDKKIL